MDLIVKNLKDAVNSHYSGYEPFYIVLEVVGAVVIIRTLQLIFSNTESIKNTAIKVIFSGLKKIPAVNNKLEKEKSSLKKLVKEKLNVKNQEQILQIPSKPLTHQQIIKVMKDIRTQEAAVYTSGKLSGCLYGADEKHTDLMNQAYALYSLSNPLHPDVFPSVRKFEIEIIRMAADMLNGDIEVCGAVTSGGTESIIMAVKTYRDKCRYAHPEMIVPVTAHAAFDKAAEYLGVKIIHINLESDMKPSVRKVENAITPNTIMIVGSAPNFPHGIIDPIPEMAAVAKKHGIGFHVDSCLGGFFLPWIKKGNDKITNFDFTVDGVTSISADTHKYGYSTKGTSVILFKNEDLRRHMFFVAANWPGGVYASPTMAGSRPGGVIACCWASLLAIGKEGFIARSKAIYETAQKIKEGIKLTDALQLIGDSYSNVIAFSSNSVDIFKICEALSAKGWHLNSLQRPNCAHFCVTYNTVGMETLLLKDLKEAVAYVRENPKSFGDGFAPVYGLAASFPDRSMVAEIGLTFLDAIYPST